MIKFTLRIMKPLNQGQLIEIEGHPRDEAHVPIKDVTQLAELEQKLEALFGTRFHISVSSDDLHDLNFDNHSDYNVKVPR